MAINDIDLLTPTDDDHIDAGAKELRDLQQELINTFPGFNGELLPEVTPDQLDTISKYVKVSPDTVTIYPNSSVNSNYSSLTIGGSGEVTFSPSGTTVLGSGAVITKDGKPYAESSLFTTNAPNNDAFINKIDSTIDSKVLNVENSLSVIATGTNNISLPDIQSSLDGLEVEIKAEEDRRKNIVTRATERFAIGDYFLTMDSVDPKVRFGGTWARLKDNVVLMSGTPASKTEYPDKEVVGSNAKSIPLQGHKHTATFKGDPLPPHKHPVVFYPPNTGGFPTLNVVYSAVAMSSLRKTTTGTAFNVEKVSAGKVSAESLTFGEAGDADTTINVLGRHLPVYIWKRIA